MSPLGKFFHDLLREGRVLLRDQRGVGAGSDAELAEVLRAAYADCCLDVAEPVMPFDQATALAAADLVQQACWALVNHALPAAELEKRVRMPRPPQAPAQHLSADLLLRYLPQVHRRARARDPADPLATMLENVLRQWPLSGVLADIDEGPEAPLDFGGHPGLMLLYAERLAQHEKPSWLPTGQTLEYVELVWAELHKDMAFLRHAEALPRHTPRVEQGESFDE